jgi:predicted nucleic acid-binding protein
MKIAVDTNVLVRIITGDNPEMASKGKNLVNKQDLKKFL